MQSAGQQGNDESQTIQSVVHEGGYYVELTIDTDSRGLPHGLQARGGIIHVPRGAVVTLAGKLMSCYRDTDSGSQIVAFGSDNRFVERIRGEEGQVRWEKS